MIIRGGFDIFGNGLDTRGRYCGQAGPTPQYFVLLINLAIAEDATKQDAAAEQHFKDALRLAPTSPDSYTYYARYLLSHSRAEEHARSCTARWSLARRMSPRATS